MKKNGSGRKKSIPRIRLEDEEVGYGKPPKAHQFKPGQSGNPSGRPKGKKNVVTLTRELLEKKISLNERGKVKRILILEALLRRALEDGLKGNIKSINFLLGLYNADTTGHAVDDLTPDDMAVLDAYLRDLKSDLAKGDLTHGPA